MRKRIHHWLQAKRFFKSLAIFATLGVVYLSLKPPSPDAQPWEFLWFRGDLVLHFSCYFGLTFLYFFAFYTLTHPLMKALFASFFLGSSMEFLQLIPVFQCFFDWQDLLANTLGLVISSVVIKGFFNYSDSE